MSNTNGDRHKEALGPEEIEALRAQLIELKSRTGWSWTTLAQKSGIPAGTLSQWAPGKYAGDQAAVALKVQRFFDKLDAQEEVELRAVRAPDFHRTPTAAHIISLLRYAQTRGKLVSIIGDPGVGKTAAFRHFARQTPNVWHVEVRATTGSVRAMLVAITLAMGFKRTNALNDVLSDLIIEQLSGREALLIVDEAQLLNEDAFEELRGLLDASGAGLVVAGNKTVQRRVEGSRGEAFAQRHSRVAMRHVIRTPLRGDVEALLDAWGVTQAAERDFLTEVALKPGDGALRRMTNILELASFVAAGGEEDEDRSLDHLHEAARQIAAGVAV